MEIVKRSLAGVPLLEIEGDIDHASSNVFDRAAVDSLDGGNRLLVDLTRCDYLDSGGLAVLLHLSRQLPPDGWLAIIVPKNNLRRLLEVVGLPACVGVRLFENASDARQALKADGD